MLSLTAPAHEASVLLHAPPGSNGSFGRCHPRVPRPRWWVLFGAVALWFATVSSLLAHDPGLSSIKVTATPAGVETIFTVHFADLEAVAPDLDVNHDGRLDAAEFARARPQLIEIARQEIEIAVGNHSLTTLGSRRGRTGGSHREQ